MEIWKFKKSLLYLYKDTTKEERVCFFENTVLILEVCSLSQNIMFLTGKSSSCEVRILFLELQRATTDFVFADRKHISNDSIDIVTKMIMIPPQIT
jgi:hypothetical protein